MTLPIPILDDRSYEQLRDAMLRRVAVYTPEWRPDPSDPGITLLELFAFLGENLLFRFNQIPDQTQLWLLHLLHVPPYPARPSHGLVTFEPTRLNATTVPAVERGSVVTAGKIPFTVAEDVHVLPLVATAAVKAEATMPADPVLKAQAEAALDAAELTGDQTPVLFTSTVLEPDPTAPDFQPLDVAAAVDHCLWIAVRPVEDAPPSVVEALFAPAGALATAEISIGVLCDRQYPTVEQVTPCETVDGVRGARPPAASAAGAPKAIAGADSECAPSEVIAVVGPEPAPGAIARADSTLHWQVSSKVASEDGEPEYIDVAVVRDTTKGLTRDGVVGIRLPAIELERIGILEGDEPDKAGTRDRPPIVDDPYGVRFWLRAFPRQGVPEIGKLRWVGVNAAEVDQLATSPPRFLGEGTGTPHQQLSLGQPSVVPETVVVEVEENGDWVRWEVVETFAGSERHDRHVVVDAAAGTVRCGDSVRGRAFGIGDRIRSLSFRYGGGRAGNVPPGAISKADATGVTVRNPAAADGGEDAEPISAALDRIPGELARRDRAVTANDFRDLASTPGVGRAECLPRFDPKTKSFEAAGVVTVVVWPTDDPRHPDAPQPDAALLRAVCQQLDARRLVTTELYVIPPTYRKIAVSVGLAIKPGFSAVGVRRWAELVLRQYLAPLPPYGPDGHGWPIGRRVHPPELEAAVLQVDGVEFVEDIKVADISGAKPVRGTVELDRWEVPHLAELTVVAGPDVPEPGKGGVEPQATNPVPVPVPKDEC